MEADAVHPNPKLAAKLSSIYKLHRVFMDFRLERSPYDELLHALGDPHLNLPPVIHVAGTNGKGSTIAMMRAILEEAGLKVHVYTSPHLIKFNERIVLAGEEVSDDTLLKYIDIVEQANKGAQVTFFEFTTALAFKMFSDYEADIVLLETGLGGRLDCTNIIKEAACSVITQIGHDHMDILGETIEEIAAEKAGIIKESGCVVLSPQNYVEARSVIEDIARQKSASFHCADSGDCQLETNLNGDHQTNNVATALKALSVVPDLNITEEQIAAALKKVRWPGRMQSLCAEMFGLDDAYKLWLDVGHNQEAAEIIALEMKKWHEQGHEIALIVGMQASKDAENFIKPLLPFTGKNIWCIDNMLSNFPQTAEELAARINAESHIARTYKEALEQIIDQCPSCHILIAGSLYLAGAVLADYEYGSEKAE